MDTLDDLVDTIYGAVASPDLWDTVFAEIRRQAAASGCVVFMTRPSGAELLYDDTLGPAALARYQSYYYARDVWMLGAAARGLFVTGAVIPDEAMIEHQRYLRSEFHTDLMRQLGVERMCGVVLAQGRAAAEPGIAMSLYRPPGAAGFEEETCALLGCLAPHLRRAIDLRLRLERGRAPAWSMPLLDSLPWGVVLLDGGGQVVHVNAEAQRIAALADGLVIVNGRLEATHRRDRCRLEAVLAGCLAGAAAARPQRGGELALERPSGCAPFLLAVIPVGPAPAERLAASAVRCAVHVSDPAQLPAQAGDRLRETFSLTPAETRLALDLLAGRSLPQAAAQRCLSSETLKTQLKSLFAKTNTSRQSALALLLQRSLNLPRQP